MLIDRLNNLNIGTIIRSYEYVDDIGIKYRTKQITCPKYYKIFFWSYINS